MLFNNWVSSGLPHSEICGCSAYSRLTTAYRSVSRPSSPLTAKAFTKRPSRAWFDPEKVRLAARNRWFGGSTFLVKSHNFILSRIFYSDYSEKCLVSVFDLDNFFCFTKHIGARSRKRPLYTDCPHTCASPSERLTHTSTSQEVIFVSLFTMSKSPNWTAKQ